MALKSLAITCEILRAIASAQVARPDYMFG